MQAVIDPEVARVVGDAQAPARRRRRAAGLQATAGAWCDVRSPDINAYLKAATGADVSAKDFRTWGATVLAAVGARRHRAATRLTQTARKRAITRAIKEVAYYLGNTPAVARSSYIDPRVFDRYRDGQTIKPALDLVGDEPTRRRSRARSRRRCSTCCELTLAALEPRRSSRRRDRRPRRPPRASATIVKI